MEPQPQKPLVIPIALSVLVSALLFGGLGYYLGTSMNTTETTALPTIMPSSPVSTTASPVQTSSESKKVFDSIEGWGFNFEIPNAWSVYIAGDILIPDDKLSEEPKISVGEKNVHFGDTNWTQVDFHLSYGDIAATLVKEAQKTRPQNWTKETLDGIVADVYTDPLENGEVTKGGTGGKTYYISLDGTKSSYKTLVISQQSNEKGSSFEKGFQALIKSFKVAK